LSTEGTLLRAKRLVSLDNYIAMKKQSYESRASRFTTLLGMYLSRQLEKAEVIFNRLDQSSFKSILRKGFCFVTDRLGRTIETKEIFESERANGVMLHFADGSVRLQ
jgi:exonuclease VII large subunit